MSFSKPGRIVIDTAIPYKLPVPYIAMGDGIDKDSTVFVMADQANSLSILGTFDEIISFASSIIAAMYSWPIHVGRTGWLGNPVTLDSDGAEVYVLRKRDEAGNPETGGSGDEAAGPGGDAA